MFLEAIALSLVKTLSSFLFSKMLVYSDVKIQGAPSWYQKADSAYVCISTYHSGGLEAVEIAKDNAKKILINKINEIIEIVIYDNYRNLENKSEKLFIKTFMKDEDLHVFVNKNIDYKNIEYIEKSNLAFVRGCISKDVILSYEKERIGIIKNKLTHKRAESAFDELDNAAN